MTRTLLLALLLLPLAAAQGPGQGQSYVSTPHEITLDIGSNEVSFRAVARLQCTPGHEGPDPVQVVLSSGATGPDDGEGMAWQFAQTTWTLAWADDGLGNFSIDETLVVDVEASGYGDQGYFGEISIGTAAASDPDACTSTGYSLPARTGHTHIQVGPRPAEEPGKDAATLWWPATVMVLALLALAWRK